MKKIKLFLVILIFFLFFFLSSCNKTDNFSIKGTISISKNEFEIKADRFIYDVEINFESKVNFELIFKNKETNYIKKYENLKYIRLSDIDFRKYSLFCKIIDNFGIPNINYKINFIKKHYWYTNRYESEPNDTFEISTEFIISSYNTFSKIGRLSNPQDIDCYAIFNDTFFDINCYIIFTDANENLIATLYDENYNKISIINKNIPFKLASKKKYFIKITSSADKYNELPYTIIIKPSTSISTNLNEFEPNNDISNANILALNQTIFGEITESDVDYFCFDIEKEGFYKILFSATSFPFYITFITDFGEFYGSYKMHRAGSFRHLLLPKGKYFIKFSPVENIKIKNISYLIKVENDTTSFEIEPNDTIEEANEFTIFDNVIGSISWEYDVDYYYISFEKNENYITISTEDLFSILHCEIFVDNTLLTSFDLKEGSYIIKINGEKVFIKLSPATFSKEIFYSIKVGN